MFYDFARKLQVTFQDPATPIAEGIIDLHHEIFHWLIIIFVPVVVIFVRIVIRSIRVWSDPQTKKNLEKRKVSYAFSGITHGTVLEIIWTITPTIILILIAIPSFGLIYAMDTIIDPDFTIKVIGNQWYWTYDFNYRALLLGDIHDIYASFVPENLTISKKYVIEQTAKLWSHNVKNHLIDSYMLSENMLTKKKGLRLLSVDNPIALPIFTNIRVLITASDVLHSFAIPSFGIKMDATPGRLSAVPLFIERPGTFYGQCSELCGIGHGVMPIEIIGYSSSSYSNFSKSLYFNRDNWVFLAAQSNGKAHNACLYVASAPNYSILFHTCTRMYGKQVFETPVGSLYLYHNRLVWLRPETRYPSDQEYLKNLVLLPPRQAHLLKDLLPSDQEYLNKTHFFSRLSPAEVEKLLDPKALPPIAASDIHDLRHDKSSVVEQPTEHHAKGDGGRP